MTARHQPPSHLPEDVRVVWEEVVTAYGEGVEAILGPPLEAYCGQVATMREAQQKLTDEGLIVADPKGVPMNHPAIAIARQAQDEIRKWGDAFRPPPSASWWGRPTSQAPEVRAYRTGG